jgi:hypothetical protein
MRINHFNKEIEITVAEAKKAGAYGTAEYNALLNAQRDFPEYRVAIIKPKGRSGDNLKGLTFDYMEAYIAKNGTEQQATEFKVLRGEKSELGHSGTPYGRMKKWFLAQFPEILAYREKIDEILRGVA